MVWRLIDEGDRLSEEGKVSTLYQLQSGDQLDFGVDIKDDEGKGIFNRLSSFIQQGFL